MSLRNLIRNHRNEAKLAHDQRIAQWVASVRADYSEPTGSIMVRRADMGENPASALRRRIEG